MAQTKEKLPENTVRRCSQIECQDEKMQWLASIGAMEFEQPIKYIYFFPDYNGSFNLSERYINETPLEKLKEQYEINKTHVQEVIKEKRLRETLHRDTEHF